MLLSEKYEIKYVSYDLGISGLYNPSVETVSR
jgi:hypothetical protein